MRNKAATLQCKKDYFARVRRSNYVASLRLEGFDVREGDARQALPSRAEVLGAYRRKVTP
ncbi:YhfG family protein [Alcanivorax sp. S71-1-4]|jgi:hypothetical protein|uniref:YhfG family protein n=1 Tax=Alcanivorax sp. S71-1-4 TaxID=1177159 RepID=UPI003FA48AE5